MTTTPTSTTPLDLVRSKLTGFRQEKEKQWVACCPAHDDTSPSLAISTGDDGRVLMSCRSQKCKMDAILTALGLSKRDLYPKSFAGFTNYDYKDEEGVCRYQVVRNNRKIAGDPGRFYQRRPDDRGGWINDMKGVRLIPYRLPELLNARDTNPEAWVFIVEGERDVDRLRRDGLTATCNPGGATKWRNEFADHLFGLRVGVIPDRDESGEKHASQVADSLVGKAKSVRIVRLPDELAAKDVSDFLAQGGTAEQLIEMAERADEYGKAPAAPSEQANKSSSAPNGKTAPARNKSRRPVFISCADVQPRPVEWLWQDRIAIGKLTLIAGDPGLGKSFLTLDIASRVSTGAPWPDDPMGITSVPGDVILMSAEDGLEDTIVPRLIKCGADTARITALGVEQFDDESGDYGMATFNLKRDLETLREAIGRKPEARLVIIDPISAYLGDTDSHNNSDVRAILEPLGRIAEESRVAVLGVTHFNKGNGGKSIYRVNGSLAFPAAARATWVVMKDAADDDRRLFLSMKNNLAADDVGGMSFRIIDGRIAWDDGRVSVSADEAMAEAELSQREPSKEEAAKAWLIDLLSAGPRPVAEIEKEATAAGLSFKGAVRRAQRALGIKPEKSLGFTGGWTWALPQGVQPELAQTRACPGNMRTLHTFADHSAN